MALVSAGLSRARLVNNPLAQTTVDGDNEAIPHFPHGKDPFGPEQA
jgi:hypothetical protein